MGTTRCRVCEATLQVWAGSEPEELRQVCGSCATAELLRLEKRVAELEGALEPLERIFQTWGPDEAVFDLEMPLDSVTWGDAVRARKVLKGGT